MSFIFDWIYSGFSNVLQFLGKTHFLMWIKHYFRCLEEFFLTFNYLIHFDVLYVEVEIAKGSPYSIYLHFMVLLQEHLKQTNKKKTL